MALRGAVVAATDFSDAGDAALREGIDWAGRLGTRLVVCHVLPEAYQVRMLFPQDAGIDGEMQGQLEARARALIHSRLETSGRCSSWAS